MKTLMLMSLFISTIANAKVVHYELEIQNQPVNLSGKKAVDFSLTVNGGIPAPTLEFTEGDDAEIVVKNRTTDQETSIHWHGILLPPEMDGVPYVNNPPILPGSEFVFRFKVRQNGTYWYHSHTMTQEQEGVYGAIVIHPKKKTISYDRDLVLMLSDWADESGESILNNLRKDGDFYLYKKGTMRSWLGAIQAGKLGSFLGNEWTRMGGMDFSDVGYDAFLINGKKELELNQFKPGERIRLRIINAGASSYFNVALGKSAMHVISADGTDIEPVMAKELLMGMAETYDVLFTVPQNQSVEFKATSQDGTGSASAWIGNGEKIFAPVKPFPDMYASMDHSAHGGAHGSHDTHATAPAPAAKDSHGCGADEYWDVPMEMCMPNPKKPVAHSHAETVETLGVDGLKATTPMVRPANAKVTEVKFVLGGDMRRYVWHINGKAIFEDRTIPVNEGDVIRFVYENTTMMHHPMHLHGHFFRVINQYGDYSPLKHTVDVPPHGTRTIEFVANEPGEWMLHCHNLYHMGTGMARVVKYTSFKPKPEIAHLQHHDHHLHDPWYFYGRAEAASNHAQMNLRLSQIWNEVETRWEVRQANDQEWEVEGDLLYHRWFGQYFHLMAGGLLFDKEVVGAAGFGYLLPMLVESHALVDHRGKIRINVDKRFQWTKTIYSDFDLTWRPNQAEHLAKDLEYEVTLMYSPAWSWAAGLMFTDRKIGAGLQVQF